MSYRCCPMIQNFSLNINGRIDAGTPCISLCCENLPDIPRIPFFETAEDTLRAFVGEGLLAALECAAVKDDSKRHFTAGCSHCAQFLEGDWQINPQITYVNLSMYPSPCQSRCIYCGVHQADQSITGEAAKSSYEKLFDMLELAEQSGIIALGATWQVSCGEIAIHPYRDRIMALVQGKRAMFYTNCMKFDEAVAQNLHDNPNSAINLSIDAGMPETWKKVKGRDNFGQAMENLARYRTESAGPGQLTMKYIVMPGINDVFEDYVSLMEIMKVLDVKHLSLSRDVRDKYHMTPEKQTELTGAAAYLLALCHKNGITNDMLSYTQQEQAETIRQANEILQRGLM